MSAILESLNAFSAAGLTAVLNTLWLAVGMTAVIWIALRSMPRINAATRHAVWWAVLALIVLMPLATLLKRPVSPGPFPAHTENQIPAPTLSSSAVKPLLVTGAVAPAPLHTSVPPRPLFSRAVAALRVCVPIEFHPGNWPSRLLFLWMAVSCVLLGRIVKSYLHLRGLRNRARPASAELVVRFGQRLIDSRTSRATQLLVSDEIISPFAAGFLHPSVILPSLLLEEIAEPELDYVLFHELAHVARRDDWTNLMGQLAFATFVLHPVAAWVLRRIGREREIACDDWVVAATGSAVHYAKTLARLFEFCCTRRRELLATGMAHQTSNLSERIEILVRPRFHFSARASLPRVSFCVAACLVLLSFAVRMPGWVAFGKNSTVAVAYTQATPQSQESAAPIAVATDQDKTWRHEWKLTRDDSASNRVRLSLIMRDDDANDRMNTQDVPLSSLDGFSLSALDHDGPIKFEYLRNAGRVLCEGRVSGGRASGPFTVVLNPSFVSALQKMGYATPHDDEAFSLVTSDVTLAYARAVRDTGLTSSVSDLIELQDHGVSSDYVRALRQEGFTNLTASSISKLRDHGVDPIYLKAIKAAGPDLSLEEIDSLYDHGVKPDYYKSMKATAPQLSIEQIDSLFDHGVEPDSYKGFASVDSKLSIGEIDSLRDHGVKPEYYRSMKSVDPNLSIEQIDSLFDHGVEPNTYKGYSAVDPQPSIPQIDSLRDHGVEPEFYQGIKAVDSTLSTDQIDSLRDHGVTPEYLKEIRALPDGFPISDICELRDHGITANYIRNLHDMGMKHLTAAQIVRIRE